MPSRKSKPALPTVLVRVRQGPPTPAQAQAWVQLWANLLQPKNPPFLGKGEEMRDHNKTHEPEQRVLENPLGTVRDPHG